jgi:hypothetical protein
VTFADPLYDSRLEKTDCVLYAFAGVLRYVLGVLGRLGKTASLKSQQVSPEPSFTTEGVSNLRG